jgi:hypothetical protein
MTSHLLAIDQGTTSSRATVFRADHTVAAIAQREIPQHFPQSGWVEHDPEDLWRTVVATGREAIARAGLAARDFAAIGITNQRETTLVWDRTSGKPIYNDAAARRHSLARRSTGRPSWRPPCLARPIWPGCNRASVRIHRRSRRAGRSTAASPLPWMKRHARERSPPSSTPSTARWAAMTWRARHRMPAVHFIGGSMRAGPMFSAP